MKMPCIDDFIWSGASSSVGLTRRPKPAATPRSSIAFFISGSV
jgi:hypothetical protein